jgi:amino acid transporter
MSHGEGLRRIWGWMLFLAYVPVPAIEAESIVTYTNNYLQPHSSGLLSATGFIVYARTGYWRSTKPRFPRCRWR